MKNTKHLLLIFLAVSVLSVRAQDKLLNFKDAIYFNTKVLPKRLSNLHWMGKSVHYTFVKDNQLMKASANTAETAQAILSLDSLNAILKPFQTSINRFPNLKWEDEKSFLFQDKGMLFKFTLQPKKLQKLNSWPDSAEISSVEPHSHSVAYTIANNLYITQNNKQIQLTDDPAHVVNGQTVARSEFGITGGLFWSPKGNFLAYYHKDERMVGDYPVVDIRPAEATVKMMKYPMTGSQNEVVQVAVYDRKKDTTIYLKTGEDTDQFLTNISWDPSEKYIYIAVLNRDQNHLKLNKYDAQSGDFVQTLFEESAPSWVEPEHPLTFLKNRDDEFIWYSKRDGWQHLYLYTNKGEFVRQLTQGEWEVNSILGFDASGKNIFIQSTKESPIEKHLYSLNLKNGKLKNLSPEHGTHSGLLSPSGDYIIDHYSNTEMASAYTAVATHSKSRIEILKDLNPLKDYALGKTIMGKLKNDQDIDLYYRMILPPHFDSTQKYPVFYYLYGGPHAQLVTDSWLGGANLFMQLMAERGYIVFTMDNRGTPNRGFAFESSIHRKLGQGESADQMHGVNFLRSLPFVDAARMGIQGWSYGGFMTLTMITKYPDVFKAAVAGGPVTDWRFYEIMYGERYMDTPQQNPEGYKQSSLLDKANQIKCRTLIIQGDIDPTVVWQNSLRFIMAAVDAGIPIDYFVYPQQEHNMRGLDRAHLLEKIYQYMEDFVKK